MEMGKGFSKRGHEPLRTTGICRDCRGSGGVLTTNDLGTADKLLACEKRGHDRDIGHHQNGTEISGIKLR